MKNIFNNTFYGILAVLVVSFSMSTHVQAQSNACAGDYNKYCKDVRPGGGRILNCLNRNADKLTAACRENVSGMLACSRDQKKFCNGVKPENWKLQMCMEKNYTELAPGCAKIVNYFRKIRKG